MAVAAVLACMLARRPADILAADNPTPSTTTPTTTSPMTPTTTSVPGQGSKGADQESCRLLPRITSKDLSAVKPLPPHKEPALQEAATNYLSCLTVAKNDRRYCKVLSEAEQDGCIVWSEAAEKLKAPTGDKPEAAAVAPLLDYECRRLSDKKVVCDELQDAIVTKNIAKCQGLPEPFGTFCKAIVSGDPSHCGDDPDCKKLVQDLKTGKKTGVSGSKGEPTSSPLAALLAAANGNERACAPLLETLQNRCRATAQ
jgi:hypothetical protein